MRRPSRAAGSVAPVSVREWVTFADPDNPDHEIRADLSWLLSRWQCIFGRGCRGIAADRPDDGCCSHGAFFSGPADERRVRAAARDLTSTDWQRYGTRALVSTDTLDGRPARRTRTVAGGCVFLNRPGSAAGAGCALHALALRTGRHPLQTKPDVCWQLPLSAVGDPERQITTVTEFSRASWGAGGATLSWWCTESAAAQAAHAPLFRTYAAELRTLLGTPVYEELARLCEQRMTGALPALELLDDPDQTGA